MLFRFFLLMIGFGFAVGGGVTLILYLNLLAVGHEFWQYLLFISSRSEFYLFLTGICLICLSIFFPKKRHQG
ncbi:MAG TPA: hypothetical protein VFK37_05985 [Bacillales bacterium]|nr:hypothetical protein [Bacillales bacterium]